MSAKPRLTCTVNTVSMAKLTLPLPLVRNLHALGKVGLLVVHVAPPFSRGYGGLDDAGVVQEVLKSLAVMFNISAVPVPEETLVTRWDQDPFSRGSYSYQGFGSSVQHIAHLAAPEWSGRLQFAGEATSVDGFQCVHGAFISGQRAAMGVAQALRLPPKPLKRHPAEDLSQQELKRPRCIAFKDLPRGRWLTTRPLTLKK